MAHINEELLSVQLGFAIRRYVAATVDVQITPVESVTNTQMIEYGKANAELSATIRETIKALASHSQAVVDAHNTTRNRHGR